MKTRRKVLILTAVTLSVVAVLSCTQENIGGCVGNWSNCSGIRTEEH